jgi:signal transduction histidine kinase
MEERVSLEFNEYYPAPLDQWFEVHSYPTEEGLAAFFRDITSKLKSEAALRQTEKLAAVGRLASSIAHEINNPLEAITNLLYLMESDQQMQQRTRDYLRTAQAELSRVSHIATQTLRFQRQSKERTEVRLTEILESVLALYTTRLSEPGISVERQFRSDSRANRRKRSPDHDSRFRPWHECSCADAAVRAVLQHETLDRHRPGALGEQRNRRQTRGPLRCSVLNPSCPSRNGVFGIPSG